jgi:tetratricopeptide (TPR) repeat protein
VAALERLGKWDAALEEYRRMQDLLRDRRDDPPYFVTHAVASVGMIHEWRGQHRESDRIRDMLVPLSGRKSARLHPGLTRLLVERGEVDRAGEYFARRPDGWRVHAAKHFEAACELVAAAGAWDEVAATVVAAQAQAAAGAGSLPAFIHRLRGRAAVAGGQEEAPAHLAAAVSAFAELETPFEAAVTRTELAGALLAGGHAKEALTELDAADETFERLGATKALQSTAALRARASATLAGDE